MPDITRYWYRESFSFLVFLLIPFSWLFGVCVYIRRWLFKIGIRKTYHLSVPVIVVGNMTVGGTGKTPFVIWLANYLRSQGYSPGIISRGYGGKRNTVPVRVESNFRPADVGDEALLLARHSNSPVMIAVDRVAAGRLLIEQSKCDIIISDDGLQHYRLARDIELIIVDGERRFGNQYLLPAGPLREPLSRLAEVDYVIVNGGDVESEITMSLVPGDLVSMQDQSKVPISHFSRQTVHAVAGIGNPERFFKVLRSAQIDLIMHTYPDHYPYSHKDFQFIDDYPIMMTEKDAVKCHLFADDRYWYLPVSVKISDTFQQQLLLKLQSLEGRYEHKNNS